MRSFEFKRTFVVNMSLSSILVPGAAACFALAGLTVWRIEIHTIRLNHRQELLTDCERVLGVSDDRTRAVAASVDAEREWLLLPFVKKAITWT